MFFTSINKYFRIYINKDFNKNKKLYLLKKLYLTRFKYKISYCLIYILTLLNLK